RTSRPIINCDIRPQCKGNYIQSIWTNSRLCSVEITKGIIRLDILCEIHLSGMWSSGVTASLDKVVCH
ncbi:hypothetical protein L9F63_012197, partial [Diploptera punctata]